MTRHLSRRIFLARTSLALPLAGAGGHATTTATSTAKPAAVRASADYFDKGTRLTIAMWDFSWLMAQPLFTLWDDADWHRTSNTYFLEAGAWLSS